MLLHRGQACHRRRLGARAPSLGRGQAAPSAVARRLGAAFPAWPALAPYTVWRDSPGRPCPSYSLDECYVEAALALSASHGRRARIRLSADRNRAIGAAGSGESRHKRGRQARHSSEPLYNTHVLSKTGLVAPAKPHALPGWPATVAWLVPASLDSSRRGSAPLGAARRGSTRLGLASTQVNAAGAVSFCASCSVYWT